jgi:hypothetical protein
MKEAASPAGLVADFYKGLIAQDVPQDARCSAGCRYCAYNRMDQGDDGLC